MKIRAPRYGVIVIFFCCVAVIIPQRSVAGSEQSSGHSDNQVDFGAQIRPLLAQKCLACHGRDEAEGGLRLTGREEALAELESGKRAILPGNPNGSELIRRISADDPDERMPPEGDPLAADQIDLLRRWIAQGVPWDVHWAYRALASGPPPAVGNHTWLRNTIDRYVLARLEAKGVAPSPAADRYRLIKRLYYDLIGLSPRPDEVDAYVTDDSPNAYEKLVDRLLASPHLGERWGRHWLDNARYADSDGFESDGNRLDAWRYRDWVIHAINQDMPFDRFTTQQLAGDLLPDAKPLEKLATAFNRQTLTNLEGGTDKEQWRVFAVMDRTETLGTVWLGLTVGCARCHNHKYDPITQKEYYQLFAYFNNGDETTTNVLVSETAWKLYEQQMAAHEGEVKQLKQRIEQSIADRPVRQAKWEQQMLAKLSESLDELMVVHPLHVTGISGDKGVEFQVREDGSYLVTGNNPGVATYTIEATLDVPRVSSFRLEILPNDSLPAKGPGRAKNGNFALTEFRVYASSGEKLDEHHRVKLAEAVADFSQDQWPVAHAIDDLEQTGWAISPQVSTGHTVTFLTVEPIGLKGQYRLRIVLSQQLGKSHTIGRFRISALTGTNPNGLLPDEVRQALTTPANQQDAAQKETLTRYYAGNDAIAARLSSQLAQLKAQSPKPPTMAVRVISQRTKNPRATHILRRGEFKQPLDEVQTGTLGILPSVESRTGDGPTDRLDLARWLVDSRNPLVPRVAVNNVWKQLFGHGLVRTINDFGVRGERPTHPGLLDYLASEYIHCGWSRKSLIRQIVNSATYRQSSRHRRELADVDPTNQLLYRQNRFRVEAEVIRDIALEASGLRSHKIGGPSVFPPISKSVTDLTYDSSFKWNTSTGEDRYRRGIYTFFKRTAPHPNLMTFDCPDSNTTSVSRSRSNTPLAALVILNNAVYVEASQAMARRILSIPVFEKGGHGGAEATSDVDHGQVDTERLTYAFRLCVVRPPEQAELIAITRLLERNRQRYLDKQADAERLVGSYRVQDVPVTENAAWLATVRILLNLDEFITRE